MSEWVGFQKRKKKEENARETGIKLRFFSLSSAKRDDLNKKTNYTQLLFIVFRVHLQRKANGMAACISGKRWASAGGRCHHRSASSFRRFFEYFRRALFAFKLVPGSCIHLVLIQPWPANANRWFEGRQAKKKSLPGTTLVLYQQVA